jgi:thiamine transport system permease protein
VSGAGELGKVLKSASFWRAALHSLECGTATGAACTLLGFAYSVAVKLGRKQASVLLQTIPVLPMAISSVVISWGATMIFHRGTPALLVALQTALYWPIAYRQIQNGINRITYETDAAARLLSRNWFDSVVRIYIPACRPVLLSAFAYCFAISLGDATMPLVLSIRNFDTLALYTYKLAGAYRFSQACACGGIVAALSMLIFSLGKK